MHTTYKKIKSKRIKSNINAKIPLDLGTFSCIYNSGFPAIQNYIVILLNEKIISPSS